jgi:L-arabinose isomerase
MNFNNIEIWFVTGAQLLYGGDAVIAVDAHSSEIVRGLNESGKLPLKIVYRGTVNSSAEIAATFAAAGNAPRCAGVITWMHTFSPAKMWIKGLQNYRKPLLHLHTQFNREIPWSEIDMDFMNLNQSAHGDREFGHIVSRMRRNRKVVVGHWMDEGVQGRIAVWMRAAAAWADAQDMLVVRFGDNMNSVAVTDGDKLWVMAQGLPGGTSFMEDYTYHFKGEQSAILQAHMLEVSPEIAAQQPRLEVHPLGIGGKADPARLVFTAHPGAGIAATIVDMGNRFRMIVNSVDVIEPEAALPKLPVASALWIPQPNLEIGAAAWILAGGTHHTAFTYALTGKYLEDYAEIAGIELLAIDRNTTLSGFKFELKVNEVYYLLNKSLR